MSLYGQNLADTVPDDCTIQQAIDVYELLGRGLREALAAKDDGALVALDSIVEGKNLAGLRDDLNTELAGVWAEEALVKDMAGDPANWGNYLLSDAYRDNLRGHVMTATMTINTATEWFTLPGFDGICDSIVAVFGKIAATIANTASKVIGNTLAPFWWLFAGLGVVLYLAYRAAPRVAHSIREARGG